MEIDITLVLVFIIGLLAGGISKVIEVVTMRVYDAKKSVPAEWHWLLDELAKVGVKAAEQVYRGQKDAAQKKLKYAYNYITITAKGYGLTFDDKTIYAKIEAEVGEINLYKKLNEAGASLPVE